MSEDDVIAEQQMAGAAAALTGLPLLGMTIGSDGTWSARTWEHIGGKEFRRRWCANVRVVQEHLQVDFSNDIVPPPTLRETFRRTVNVWGSDAHATLSRLRIGIVGLGSVGSLVAETLARMGFVRFVLVDFDRVEPHNLDRLVTATHSDIGELKVDVAERRMRSVATAASIEVRAVPFSIVEEPGYLAALDCDVIISCVDRPRARSVIDHLAFAHLIPAIDGGIQVRFKSGQFSGVDWQVQTVFPNRACRECLGAYDQGDVSTETSGKLDDPSYMAGLPSDHRFKQNENVFPFAANLASLEVFHLIALASRTGPIHDFGVQRFRYIPGILDQRMGERCRDDCDRAQLIAQGDRHFHLMGLDLTAVASREKATSLGHQASCAGPFD